MVMRSWTRGDTHVVQRNKLGRPTTILVTNGVENAVSDNSGKNLLNKEQEKTETDEGQAKVVNFKESFELEGLLTSHNLPTAEDDNVVGNQD